MTQVTPGVALGGVHGFTASLTSFVGRVDEVAELAGLLGEYRLVTVTGPGGVGKTRLAAEVARQVAGRFADGVWLVELASVPEPALLEAGVAAALGLHQAPGMSILDSLAVVLGRQQVLLVLDNCEHLITAVAELCGSVLPAADDVRVLATSREPIGVPGEVGYRLGPLGLPGPGDEAEVVASEAVRLFADRARRGDPHFALDGVSGPMVAELVRRLDGMPLAIELAAARVEALGVAQLLDRLDDRLGLLVAKDRLATARQRSLAAAAEWSYRLLDEPEQRVFRRLAVFPGPFTLEAAEAVAGSGAGPMVLHLVDCSLLAPPRVGPDRRSRYLMLETLRGYAGERLTEAGEQPVAAAGLVAYACRVADQAAAGLATNAEEVAAARWLDAEDATVHRALAWALDHDSAAALRLATALAPWWRIRGRVAAGYDLLRAAAGHAAEGGEAWCIAQVSLGDLAYGPAVGTTSLDHYTVARDVLEARAPSPALVQAHLGRARCLLNSDHIPEAAEAASRALELARHLGYPAGEAYALYLLGGVEHYRGDHASALEWLRRAQRVDRTDVPASTARRCDQGLAIALKEAGELSSARHYSALAQESASRAGDLGDQSDCLSFAAELDLKTGDLPGARANLREAIQLAVRSPGRTILVDSLDQCGHLCAQSSDWAAAVTVWAAHAAYLRDSGTPDLPQDARLRQEPLDQARQALGPEQAQAAGERGAAMTLTAAAEYALLQVSEPEESAKVPGLARLSARERELVTLVAQGHTDVQIAGQLVISARTVSSHLDRIRDKTGCRRRADLTRLALQAGLV